MAQTNVFSYKRSRFSTRLPVDRRYTPSHFWLVQGAEPEIWRVGFTKFATRMLGDLVEFGFQSKPGDGVTVGQAIGWVEGFKAITDLYCVGEGQFVRGNPGLNKDVTLADTDPYGEGWLYEIRGQPEPNNVDVQGYTEILDLTIDKMQDKGPAGEANEHEDCNT